MAKNIYIADFETTVYKGQNRTDVWASAIVPLNSEDVVILGSISDTYDYFKSLKQNMTVYYHNLKFDGSFWLDYLLKEKHFKNAIEDGKWKERKHLKANEVMYLISDMGQWYSITFKIGKYTIELRDSMKLLPFSVKRIGKAFKTKHQKLEMQYEGFRYPNCPITPEEREYIANDVLVVKEALEIMLAQGHNKMTIGSCCLKEFKNTKGEWEYKELFPDLTEVETPTGDTYDKYIRRSYRGGWCYLAKGKEDKVFHNGTTADVNSLYPSMMSSESGNYFPVGTPVFWQGDYIPDVALKEDMYYFIRVKTGFKIKDGKLPFIQIKNSALYKGTEMLETSEIWNFKTGEYSRYYIGFDGEIVDTDVELTLTQTDWELIKEHYNLYNTKIIDGVYFHAQKGIFDDYLEKWRQIKETSTGAMRELAKLFMNNLYGKMASSDDSSFKLADIDENNQIYFTTVEEHDKKTGYIPVGSAITSYARNFTIRAAQKNYHGVDKPGFIYADTDSIHCDLSPDEIIGVPVHPTHFCHWKLESQWDYGLFVRQKTYLEHVVAENLEPIDKPFYNIKCAGMPERCKKIFLLSVEGYTEDDLKELSEVEQEFVKENHEITDFSLGLCVPGKLLPKRIDGGILLVSTTYQMR